jgi:FAD/FMN-containing dehydrogenase
VTGPPPLPTGGRESLRPSVLPSLTGEFVAEVGVGVVHRPHAVAAPVPHPSTMELQRRIKALFDPTGRLNPGRSVLGAAA